jgi:hypothetical protein
MTSHPRRKQLRNQRREEHKCKAVPKRISFIKFKCGNYVFQDVMQASSYAGKGKKVKAKEVGVNYHIVSSLHRVFQS